MSLDRYIDDCLRRGRAYFAREEVSSALALEPDALSAAITRLIKRGRLASPRHGFYLILRPEDRNAGAPDPAKWIDPLMKHQGIDYRVSLLRAAAFHGSSHQAAMVFQVVVPRQLRDFEIGRHRLQFLYQSPEMFALANAPEYLAALKTEAGYAKLAGAEVALLDCARYFHKVGGINAVAQIVKDIGGKANPRLLGRFRSVYENTSLRRLGYLLDLFGHERQAKALDPCLAKVKTAVPLDPSSKPLLPALAKEWPREAKWKLLLNEPVEIDS
jgi:predicted transcriptional regulator of viral defense system